jgi:hypothetical protein
MSPSVSCVRCNSTKIATRDYARKTGSAVGAAAGAAGSAAAALGGAEAGATLGLIAGPVGSIFGGLAGALLGALVGGAAGCAAGSAVGEQIDTHVLENYECLECGHTFGTQRGSYLASSFVVPVPLFDAMSTALRGCRHLCCLPFHYLLGASPCISFNP